MKIKRFCIVSFLAGALFCIGSPAFVSAQSAPAGEYKIGDTGPAGGIVFYDKRVVTNGWRYMEAAPFDLGPVQWAVNFSKVRFSGSGFGAGTGKANTQRIVPVLKELGEEGAALLCAELDINGYTDWFLPSRDELDLMYKNLKAKGRGGFGSDRYWSSSSSSAEVLLEYYQQFDNGKTSNQDSRNLYLVRACRQF
ncbi:MAG: hypothetical protein LBK61_09625 [Spirochaetaceae bacterium]|jgi:hypothetical protein|nr:hypothetical protein [Spirochaetaceae bacterium]